MGSIVEPGEGRVEVDGTVDVEGIVVVEGSEEVRPDVAVPRVDSIWSPVGADGVGSVPGSNVGWLEGREGVLAITEGVGAGGAGGNCGSTFIEGDVVGASANGDEGPEPFGPALTFPRPGPTADALNPFPSCQAAAGVLEVSGDRAMASDHRGAEAVGSLVMSCAVGSAGDPAADPKPGTSVPIPTATAVIAVAADVTRTDEAVGKKAAPCWKAT